MTQYNILTVKMSNLQFTKLKSGMKNGTEVTLNLSLNLICDSNYKANFKGFVKILQMVHQLI